MIASMTRCFSFVPLQVQPFLWELNSSRSDNLPIRQKKDLRKDVLSSKRVWVRVADPAQVKRKLSANSIAFLQFWLHWCKLPTLLRPLQFPARTTMVAAADAMGSGTKFAIGGFIKLSTSTI